jgi:hypothetical protein
MTEFDPDSFKLKPAPVSSAMFQANLSHDYLGPKANVMIAILGKFGQKYQCYDLFLGKNAQILPVFRRKYKVHPKKRK